MSYPNIPDVDASINITINDDVNLLLASVAFEELGLAHIINAEAEKIQYVLGTLESQESMETPPTIDELLEINKSVDMTLRNVIKNQMLLQFKLEDTLTITTTSTTSTTTTTTGDFIRVGSAWSEGTHFGTSKIAQYTTLESDEPGKTVDLLMGADQIKVGTVEISRSDDNNNLFVTITTDSPYIMSQAHLYVDDEAPTDSAPGQLGHTYDPGFLFATYTFTVDISELGEPLYIAAHATIFQQV